MRLGVKRLVAIGGAAAIFVLSSLLWTRLRLDEDVTAMLPDSDPVVGDYRVIVSRFRALDALYIDVAALSDGADAQAHAVAVAEALHERLEGSGQFRAIQYRTSPESFMRGLDRLRAARWCLLPEQALADVEARLGREAIRQRLMTARRALIEPSGPFVRDRIRRDPLAIDDLALSCLRSLASAGGAAPSLDGRIWSKDERHILMVGTPVFPAMDTRRGEALVGMLETARAAALGAAPHGSVRVSYVGGHRSALENAGTIKRDVKRTIAATSLGILALGLLFFRRKVFIVLVFLPAAFGMAVATMAFALFDPLISAVAIGCGAVLIGIAVDYGVHILYRLDQMEGRPLEPSACVRAMLLPLAVGAATTVVGLLCLLTASLPGQRQMGLFAALGILGSALFAVLVLPQVTPRGGEPSGRRAVPLAAWCGAFLAWRARHERAFGVALVAALGVGVAGISRLRFESKVEAINYTTEANRSDTELIRGVWGGFPSTALVARGPTLQAALEANDRVFAVLREVEARGEAEGLISVAAVLPSVATQEANRARSRAMWSHERVAAVKEAMTAAARDLGFSAEAFQPFFDDLAADAPPLTLAGLEGTALEPLIRSRIAESDGEVLVLSTLSLPDDAAAPEVLAHIRSRVPDAVVMNGRELAVHTTEIVRGDLRTLIACGGVAMAVCLYLFLGRVELAATALLPVCLSVLFTLGLLGLFGIRVNLISSLFVVFVFGVGLDYSIFLLSSALTRYRGTGGHEGSTAGSVVICALTTMCGFGAMALARHPALFSIGITGTLGMASSLVFGVLMVPALAGRLLPDEGRSGSPSLKTLGGGLWAYSYLVCMGLVYTCVLRYVMLLRHRRDVRARQRFARRFLHAMAVGLLRFFPYLDSDDIYLDASAEAFEPPCVIVSNHLAAFDIMVVLALPTEMVMLVRAWVWNTPIMGRMIRDAGYILMRPGDPEHFLARGAEMLEQGVPVMVFPESTRSKDGRMHRFHKGAFELAVRTRTDVVPVLLSNTQSCTPRGGLWIGDYRAVARVLPRITPDDFDYGQGARPLGRHVKARMLAHLDEDWRLSQRGRSFRHNIRSLYAYRGAFVERYVAWKLRLDPILRHVDDHVPLEGLVVDLGCGYGLMSNILARRSQRREVVGVDRDERKIAVARGTAAATRNVSFERADIFEWQGPAADAVLLIDVTHYWDPGHQRRLIAAAAAALKEGGTMVFRDICAAATLRHRLTALTERVSTAIGHNRAWGHHAAWCPPLHFGTRQFYLDAVAEAGLTVCAEPAELSIGSNVTLILRSVRQAHAALSLPKGKDGPCATT